MLNKQHVPMVAEVFGPTHRPISNAEWNFLEPFVIENPRRSGRPPRNHRLVMDGIFWVSCTGGSWRKLPQEYGPWSSVYRQFNRWTKGGLWEALLETIKNTRAQSHPDVIDVFAEADLDTMSEFIKQAQIVALRPRYIRQPQTFTY